SAELTGRDELEEAGRGGKGEVAVAKSSVATSSVLLAGVPHAEQKRPVDGTSVPQDEQAGMNFPDTVYRVRNQNVSGDSDEYATQEGLPKSEARGVLPSKR